MKKTTAQRNIIADAFFECVSDFCRRTGAVGFDSKAEYISGKREKGLMKMSCSADYEKFIMEFSYNALACAPGCAPSVFDVAVLLEPHKSQYRYSLYDLMYLLEPDNYKCYRFSYIESPERMKLCFSSVEPDFKRFLPRLAAIASESEAVANIRSKLTDAVLGYYGYNVFEQVGDESSGAEFALRRYYSAYQLRFDSTYYAAFLRGDYKKALKLYGRARNKTYYEIRLVSYMQTLEAGGIRYTPTQDGCDPLNAGFGTVSRGTEFLVFFGGALALWIPCALVCIGLYYLAALLMFKGAFYCDAFELSSALDAAAFAFIPAVVGSSYLDRAGIYLAGKQKREKLKRYGELRDKKANGCLTVVNIAAIVMTVLYLFSAVRMSAAYYNGYFKYGSDVSSFTVETVPYSDVLCVIHSEGGYDSDGMWYDYEAYYIVLENRNSYFVSASIGPDVFKEKVLPELVSRGVKLVEVRDAGEYIDAGTAK